MTDIDTTSETVKLASSTWMRVTGIRVSDQVGWTVAFARYYPKNFEEPISRAEFFQRAQFCDVTRWPDPPYDERPTPSRWFVERLAESLKSEFGALFGMGINAADETWLRVASGLARKMRCEDSDESGGTMVVAFDPRVSE